ncbi:glycosyltransferase family 61 protein [Cyanobium sp. BA20m-p-22]|uniref:glycosyltransferase family 61 protein n=1 Tax=Cyanobium sp. BA20m-p-22 TaxID=2823704 RepID=UPI0020CC8A9E|nr:glycosyltransferase family 61 protein [Cyanobium sp. BA20m-p-22]MCP9911657.1 glycosyltransferase family 61 protein [Cyanobium sp. BA20m-p-22]
MDVNSFEVGNSEIKKSWRPYNPYRCQLGRIALHLPEIIIPPLRVTILAQARILSRYGQLYTSDLQPLDADTREQHVFNACAGSLLLPLTRIQSEAQDDILLALFDSRQWHLNYFHWICDYLPKIIWAERFLESQKHRLRLLIYTNQKAKTPHLQTLKTLGYEKTNVIELNPDNIYSNVTLRNMMRVESRYRNGGDIPIDQMHPSVYEEIGNRIKIFVASASRRSYAANLYISRGRAGTRRIINEREILPILIEHGFEILELETMEFNDQVAAFSEARVVIAPHGAGLTNVLFSRNAKVLELFSLGHGIRPEFFQLTMIRKGEYYFHTFESENKNDDFIFSKELVVQYLTLLLS